MANIVYHTANIINGLINPEVRGARKLLKATSQMSLQELDAYKSQKFIELVSYCEREVPYYQQIMLEHNIKAAKIKHWKDIEQFPVLTKEILRNENEQLIAKKLKDYKYIKRRSGGTTGEPIQVLVDKYTAALETYSYFRGLEWMGWDSKLTTVKLFGGSLGLGANQNIKTKLRSWALKEFKIPAFDIRRDTASMYLEQIKRNGPCILIGYASVLYHLAIYKKELNFELNNVKGIFSTSELLISPWYEVIKDAFGCSVKSYYGCGEVNSLGYQVEDSGAYIIPDEVNLVESSEKENIDIPDNSLLITSLHNRVMPLIRYVNGDLGVVIEGSKETMNRTSIQNLIGRVDDMFFHENGVQLSGRIGAKIITVTKTRVEKFQFIQKDFRNFEFKYDLLGSELTNEECLEINNALNNVFGYPIEVDFNRTTDFTISHSGKHRISINKMDASKIKSSM